MHQSNVGKQQKPSIIQKDGKRRIETANVKALADLKVGLINNARFGKMAMYSIECIGKMAVDETTVEEICESGTIQASLNACLQNKKNESLQHQTNKTILKAAKINQSCTLGMSRTIKQEFTAFKHAIDNYSGDEVLTSTADVLGLLANAPGEEGEKNRKAMREQGIYESVADKIASGCVTDPHTLASLSTFLATGASDPATAQQIIDKGVFQELLKQTKKHPNNVELARAFAALAEAASKAGDHIVAQLKELGVATTFSELLTQFPRDKQIISSITDSIGGLSTSSDVAPLMAVLRDTNQKDASGLSDEDLLRQKLEASARLATLTMVKQNLAYFKGGNGISDVIASYNALLTDLQYYNSEANLNTANPLQVPSVLLEALTQSSIMLSNIANKGAETQRYAILTNGGVDAITQVLQALREQHDIAKANRDYKTQAKCVEAMAAAFDGLSALLSRKENVQFLEQSNALPIALAAIQGLGSDPALQNSLLDMILKAMEHFDELSPETVQQMLQALLDIIRSGKVPTDPETARKLAQAMCMLAIDEEAERAIVGAGGVDYLLKMLDLHQNDPNVVKQLLQALELALQTQEGMDAFIKAGGEQRLRDLKQLWRDDSEICSMIDGLMAMCKDYREGKTVFAKSMGQKSVEQLMKMLNTNKHNPELVQSLLQALELAIQTRDGMEAFLKMGGEGKLRELRHLYANNPHICSIIDNLLNLCNAYKAGNATLFSQGAIDAASIPVLLDMLERHKDDPVVVKQLLEALKLSLQTPEGMEAFFAAGGEDLLRNLRLLHKDDAELCALIDQLLAMCNDYRTSSLIDPRKGGANRQHGHVSAINGGASAGILNEGNLMLAGLLGQTPQPPLPTQPIPRNGLTSLDIEEESRRQGFNALDIEEGQRRQGLNALSIEDEQLAGGFDIMNQLRAFGLGGGLGAEMIAGLGSMGQYNDPNAMNNLNNMQSTSTIMTTTTQLLENQTETLSLQEQHFINTINQVQLYITERRAAKLLSLFETLFMQEQSYDRDYLLNAVLDGLAAICEEGFECEQEILRQNGNIPYEIQPYVNMLGYSNVLNELEQGLIENQVGQRLCQRILQTDNELDIAVGSDNLATILSLITRDCVTLIHVKFGLKPQINPNVETDQAPYQSSNPFLSSNARKYAVQNAYVAFDEAFADLMEQRVNEKQRLTIERQLEVERLKKLTQVTMTAENQKVLDRIEAAKAEAAQKAREQKEALQLRLEAARQQQEENIKKMNEDAELRRQRQIEDILNAARTATLAKVELEKRLAEGGGLTRKARTREDILRRLDDKTKNFLITGQLVTKHNEITGPSGRHIYVTPNLEYIVYRHAGQAEVKKSQMIKLGKFLGVKQGPLCKDLDTFRLRAEKKRAKIEAQLARGEAVDKEDRVNEGSGATKFITEDDWDDDRIDLPGLHKESMWHGAIPRRATMAAPGANNHLVDVDDEEIPTQYSDSPFFVLVGFDMSGKEREIGFECENVDTCKKIIRAYTRLYEYSSTLNEFQGDDTMQMVSNPLHNIDQAEKGLSQLVASEKEKSDRIHQWKQKNNIIAGGQQHGPSFDDLLGGDDPWANE